MRSPRLRARGERADRRWLMVGADLVRAACLGLLTLAVLTGRASILVLLVVFFLTTSADTVFHNASQAALPMVIDRDGLPRANARFQTVRIAGTTLLGPPLGGVLFGAAAAAPFALDAASFLASAALVATLRGRLRPERTGHSSTIRADIAEGARWLLRHRVLRTICWVLTWRTSSRWPGSSCWSCWPDRNSAWTPAVTGCCWPASPSAGWEERPSLSGSTGGSGTPAA